MDEMVLWYLVASVIVYSVFGFAAGLIYLGYHLLSRLAKVMNKYEDTRGR